MEKIVVFNSEKILFVKDISKDFHCEYGIIKKEDLKHAHSSKTNTGKPFWVMDADFSDKYRRIKRGPQIIPLKDVGSIITEGALGKNSVVIDAGSGSGSLACILATIAKQVYSYEIREDFHKIASENADRLGLKNLTVKHKDASTGFDEQDVDCVVLDLGNPWELVQSAYDSLRVGGHLISYSPTIPQVSDFVAEVKKNEKLLYLRTIEMVERDWEVSDRKVRPKSQQIGHSGFLSVVRKIN